MDHHAALACLDWQIELGATEAIGDLPVNRYELAQPAPAARGRASGAAAGPVPAPAAAAPDPVAEARAAAGGAASLEALRAALAEFEHCDLRRGARNLVFADGVPGAPLMVIGEAPGREEDRAGLPFVGPAGQMLDRMLAAIGLDRKRSVYITNVLPWRPPQNRDPLPAEIAMMVPFLERHVDLAAPKLIVLMGNISCQAVLGRRGITRLRGQWEAALGRPVMPMFHPAYLLRQPQAKRAAWADLLEVAAKLEELA